MGNNSSMTTSRSACEARAAVLLTLGQFRMMRAHLDESSNGTWAPIADESSLALSSISNIAAHVELFVTVAVIEKIGHGLQKLPAKAGTHVLGALAKEVESNWDGRLTILTEFTGKSVKQDWPNWMAWNGFIAARNAWAHGQGKLTRRQLRDKSLDNSVTAAGLIRIGDQLRADDAAVRRAALLGEELIDMVDVAAGLRDR